MYQKTFHTIRMKLEKFQLLKEMSIEGKSHLEMAQKHDISVAACKKRVQQAKEFLKRDCDENTPAETAGVFFILIVQ